MIWIELLGLPASGKSTHAAILTAALRRRGFAAYGRSEGLAKCLRARDGVLLGAAKLLAPGVRKRLDNTDYAMPELCSFAARNPAAVAAVLDSLARRQLPDRDRRTWVVPTFRTLAEYQMAAERLATSDIMVHDEGLAHRCYTMFGYLNEPAPTVEIETYLRHTPRIDFAVWTDVTPEASNERIENRGLGGPRVWFADMPLAQRIACLTRGRECLATVARTIECAGVPLLRIDNNRPAGEAETAIESWVTSIEGQLRSKVRA